jgi:hypothetical protein
MPKEDALRPNSLSALRRRQQQEEEERRKEQEYKGRLEEIYLSQQPRFSEPVVVEEVIDDAERRWRQERTDRIEYQCRLLAEFERHNLVLEQILARLENGSRV